MGAPPMVRADSLSLLPVCGTAPVRSSTPSQAEVIRWLSLSLEELIEWTTAFSLLLPAIPDMPT